MLTSINFNISTWNELELGLAEQFKAEGSEVIFGHMIQRHAWVPHAAHYSCARVATD